MRQFAVIGLGRFGLSVAKTLAEQGCQVLAIDKDEQLVQYASEFVTEAVQADSTDDQALKAVGIKNADVVVVGIGTDLEASILTTLTLKEMGVQEIVARAVTEKHGKVLEKVGATKVVFLERDMGTRVANSLVSPSIIEHIYLSPEFSIMETMAPQAFIEQSIGGLDIRAKHGLTIIGVRNKSRPDNKKCELNIAPRADYVITQGDVLILLGSNENLNKFKQIDK